MLKYRVMKGVRFPGRDSTGQKFDGYLVVLRDAGYYSIESYHRTKRDADARAKELNQRSNPSRRKTKKRAKRLMKSGSKKLASWVRSQTNRGQRKKNPVRVGAQVVGSGTGWIKAKAVKVRKSGKGYVVDVKR